MQEPNGFLVVEQTGGLAIFPAHENDVRDEAFARSMGYQLIQRCSTREEAESLVGELTDKAIGQWYSKS